VRQGRIVFQLGGEEIPLGIGDAMHFTSDNMRAAARTRRRAT
jgi:hypothetical protein